MMNAEDPSGPLAQYELLKRRYQQLLDRAAPHTRNRWLATGGLVALFVLRIVFAQGVRTVPLLSRWALLTRCVCAVVHWCAAHSRHRPRTFPDATRLSTVCCPWPILLCMNCY